VSQLNDDSQPDACRSWWRERAWPFLREHHWVGIGMLWLLAFALGYIGTIKQLAATGEARSALDPFYRALQLFLMDDGMVVAGPIRSWELELARFLSPAAAAYTAVAALVALLQTAVHKLLLCRRHEHVVICGLGRKGLALARDCRRHGERVVAIELDAENDAVTVCRDLGVTVLIGDAAESATLRQARVHTASRVAAVTGSDGTNVEIAVRTYRLVTELAAGHTKRVRCFVHVVDLKLRALFGRHPLFTNTQDAFEITVFNVYENAARLLFERHPMDGGGIRPGEPRDVHLVVVGFGQMGESVVLQAVRTGHFANHHKLSVTIVDQDAAARSRSFLARYPGFAATCAAEFFEHDVEDTAFLDRVAEWAADATANTIFVIALDDDAQALSSALSVLAHVEESGIPIIVRMGEEGGLAVLLRGKAGSADWLANVHPFGMPCDTCTRRMLLDEDLDRIARGIHEDFVAQRRAEGRPENDPSLQPWEKLPPDFKDSNRQQADHIAVKLRAAGCRAVPVAMAGRAPAEFTPDEIETLAIMEHDRWVAERLLAGWTLGPKDAVRRRSPYLVKWEQVPDPIREYDRVAVRRIPLLLSLCGLTMCRNAQ
jgi:voltage-gated potassium channel Kch